MALPTAALKLNITLGTPCSMKWSDLKGDDRVRDCKKCEKKVFNVERMTNAEILNLVKSGQPAPCLKLYRRLDGTVMTADCKNQWAKIAFDYTVHVVALGLMLATGGLGWALADNIKALLVCMEMHSVECQTWKHDRSEATLVPNRAQLKRRRLSRQMTP
jgi:hypothetical protein